MSVARRGLAGLALVAVTACFAPDYPTGLACGPDGFCPPGQVCVVADQICVAATPGDGGPAGAVDARWPDAGQGQLVALSIGDAVTLLVAGTHAFVVTAIYENGTETVDPVTVIWMSSNNAVMYIDFMGVAHGESAGVATATARWEGRVGEAEVTVIAPMP
jgi:hypothetical protein